MASLADLDVLVIDCQATRAGPRGHLLELGWMRAGRRPSSAQARLIRLPDDARLPPAVARVTGLTEAQLRGGCDPETAGVALAADAADLGVQPTPTVAHYARFEASWLPSLRAAGAPVALDLICTHAIARRFFPDLPRRSLRALAGYLGAAIGPLRRSAEHVEATAFVWRELARRLAAEGVCTWDALHAWLAAPAAPLPPRRSWPLPRATRLALPDTPGVYRFLRAGGSVLYVGKAASLHQRVNSYFRRQHGTPDRLLEMLTQARDVSIAPTATILEAALLECDEIKRHGAPYNVALAEADRTLWFASRDLATRRPCPDAACPTGPFASADTLDRFAALVQRRCEALGRDRWAPAPPVFDAGLDAFRRAHRELADGRGADSTRLLRLGTRLWREGRRDGDLDDAADDVVPVWTPERVQRALEWLAIRAAWSRRRARWLVRLSEATILWREPEGTTARLILIEKGVAGAATDAADDAPPPVPPGHARPRAERLETFTVASHDRLRVLTTELKRLAAQTAPLAVRLGAAAPLDRRQLARLLAWV